MRFSLRQTTKLSVIAFGMLVILILLATAAVTPRWFHSGNGKESRMVVLPPAWLPAIADPTPEPITAEVLTLTSAGFFPREFTHPKTRFILVVNNRTEEPEINLTLSRDKGNKVREKQKDAKVLKKQPDWNDLLDLTPGDYVLSVDGHPKWECRITITAR